jgi:serine/threonine protein kinase/tetratricopeptide (TPR) repeat protein
MMSDAQKSGGDTGSGDVPLEPREIRVCPTCKTPLTADSASEFCPVCMLRSGLSDIAESTVSASSLLEDRFEHYALMKGEDGAPIELGRGAMGVTYKAFDVDLRLTVTLKMVSARYLGDESARVRFLREARAAASVRHPNVASVFHLGKSGGNYFYAMEFVDGETLGNLITRSGRLQVEPALNIVAQVAAGLAAVNRQNLVHRDIKPTNIMVSPEEEGSQTAKIIDLGLAKAVTEMPSEDAISTPGAFAGTPEFSSPEQFAGVGVDIRSDLYSLGVTLWNMLTGRLPFQGSPAEVMYQQQHAPLPLGQLNSVPQSVRVLLEILLEKDPARRFQSPDQLLKVIPIVIGAIRVGRLMTPQRLREIAVEPLSVRENAYGILTRVRAVGTSPRVRPILWTALALLIAGSLMLPVLFKFIRPAFEGAATSSRAIKVPEKSIAVLPFESLSDNKNDIYFADGIQDEILSDLAKVSQLRVISRTSVMSYRPGGNRDLRSIGNALGVAHVVEGTVRRDVNRVRVTIGLIDARTDETLWSESYDRDMTDIFAIQSDIAQRIAARLSARLTPEERKGIEEKPTNNLEAYDLYLQAKQLIENSSFLSNKEENETLLKAIRFSEEATRMDPKFALAYCLIAQANDTLYLDRIDQTPDRYALGDAALNEALRLRPDLPEVHLATAFHRYVRFGEEESARFEATIAKQSLPNSPEAMRLIAEIDRRQGRWEESTRGLEEAVTLDPRNPESISQLAINYREQRRYRDYEQASGRLIELEPDKPYLKVLKASGALFGKAQLANYRAALEGLPSSVKDNVSFASWRFSTDLLARDWRAAKEILSKTSHPEFYFFVEAGMVPRGCLEIWLARLQGGHLTMEGEFAVARDQLNRKVEENPEDATLLSALGMIDAALGQEQAAIAEGKRAVEMLPISKDALNGPFLVANLAAIYAQTSEPDLALQLLGNSIDTPAGVTYGDLKLNPQWDPLRKDPRFDKLVARLAPHD